MNELTDEQITSIAYDCNALPEVVTDETLAIFACAVIAADRALQNNAWRKAIDDARLSLMLDITAPDANPAASVKELVAWANELALNPAISSDAQALIDRGLAMQAERHAEELADYELTVANLRGEPEREPMTEDQLEALYREHSGYSGTDFSSFARAVEAFHGIKENP